MNPQTVDEVAAALFERCKALESKVYRQDITIRALKDALRDANELLEQFGAPVERL